MLSREATAIYIIAAIMVIILIWLAAASFEADG
jgi:hypothetical protein